MMSNPDREMAEMNMPKSTRKFSRAGFPDLTDYTDIFNYSSEAKELQRKKRFRSRIQSCFQ